MAYDRTACTREVFYRGFEIAIAACALEGFALVTVRLKGGPDRVDRTFGFDVSAPDAETACVNAEAEIMTIVDDLLFAQAEQASA